MNNQKIALTLLVTLLIAGASISAVCNATQPFSCWIEVFSPENNYVYPSGDVWLKFGPPKGLDINYSSYSINLDGQNQNIASNTTFLLQNLQAGSHKLTIYGNVSTGYFANQTERLSIVYFNVYYSSNWVTFILSLSIFVALLSVILLTTRRRLTMRLKGKKNGLFWFGLLIVILASMVVIPLGYGMLYDYLFPHYNYLIVRLLPDPFVYGGLAAIGVGFLFMAFGTAQLKPLKRKLTHP
jgi:hypothetical protein